MRISDWSSDVCSSDLVDVRELGQQIGKAGEKPTVRERRRHLNSDDSQSGALLAAQPDIARGSAQPAYALSYGSFVHTVFDFVLVALAIFLMVRAITHLTKPPQPEAPAAAPEPSVEERLLA